MDVFADGGLYLERDAGVGSDFGGDFIDGWVGDWGLVLLGVLSQ